MICGFSVLTKQFAVFLLSGGLAAAANFVCRILLSYSGVSFHLAVVLSYLVGMFIAFALFRKVVFTHSRTSLVRAATGFIMVNCVGIAVTFTVSSLCFYYIFPMLSFDFFSAEIAHFLGLSFTAFTSFWGHKIFSFRE